MVYTSVPWKERLIVEERMRFVLRLKDGESMAPLCREFGSSRVTGYKIYQRHKDCGLDTGPAGSNFLQQQAKFDAFVRDSNYERPHEALAMKCPADIYTSLAGQAVGIKEVDDRIWLLSWTTISVTSILRKGLCSL